MKGILFDIKEMALHDGPGARVTVFLKGCPLRCMWCHNPEGLSTEPQILVKESLCRHCGACRKPCTHPECQPFSRCLYACPNGLIERSGEEWTAGALAQRLGCYEEFFKRCGGGVTFSGGEPLLQSGFLFETARRLPFHKALETSGYAEPDIFRQAVELMDYVMLDIKLADDNLHRQYTGRGNKLILKNLAQLKDSGKPYLIRTPLIPGITDTKENLDAIRTLIGGAPWEKLSYNALAGAKYPMLGLSYPYEEFMASGPKAQNASSSKEHYL